MKKIRLSYFVSSVCAFVFALIFLFGAPMFMETVKSDPTKPNVTDVIVPLNVLFYFGGGVFLYIAFIDAKYSILAEEGISLCILGITYRKVLWGNIFDVTLGPDPFEKYTTRTLLLNCRPDIKYYPQNRTGASMYEKAFYKDLFRGKIIRLRCGKKLDSVLMLLNEYVSKDVMQQMRKF